MGYILKAPSGGGGGGDATAANQAIQIAQDATAANQLTQLLATQINNTYNTISIQGINQVDLKALISTFIGSLAGPTTIVNIISIGSSPLTACGVIIIYK